MRVRHTEGNRCQRAVVSYIKENRSLARILSSEPGRPSNHGANKRAIRGDSILIKRPSNGYRYIVPRIRRGERWGCRQESGKIRMPQGWSASLIFFSGGIRKIAYRFLLRLASMGQLDFTGPVHRLLGNQDDLFLEYNRKVSYKFASVAVAGPFPGRAYFRR